jgi:hypothetical protein
MKAIGKSTNRVANRRAVKTRGSIMVLTICVLFIVAGFVLALVTVASSGQRIAGINSKRLTARGLAEGAVELGKNWAQTEWANQDGPNVMAKAVTKLDELSNPAAWTTVDISGNSARFAMVRVPPVVNPAPTMASKVNYTPDGLGWFVDGTDGVRTMHYLLAFYGRSEYTPKTHEGDSRTVSASVSRVAELEVTPLFQFAVFYNSDLEIQPGPNMKLTGRVHTNRDMYLGSGALGRQDVRQAQGQRHPADGQRPHQEPRELLRRVHDERFPAPAAEWLDSAVEHVLEDADELHGDPDDVGLRLELRRLRLERRRVARRQQGLEALGLPGHGVLGRHGADLRHGRAEVAASATEYLP